MMRTALVAVLFLFAAPANAVDYRVEATPGRIQALIGSGRLVAGDRIVLGSGRHGAIVIDGLKFNVPVVVTTEQGMRPILDRLVIRKSAGWRIEGLSVTPSNDMKSNGALVEIQQGREIYLDRLTVTSADDSSNWSAAKWRKSARNGIMISGRDITVANSLIRNVRHGISSHAVDAKIENNVIEKFSGDGIRGLGDNSDYIGNTIDTCVGVGNNHDDGFQSWSLDSRGRPGKGTVRNVRVERNLIRNGKHRLNCNLQGIGLFDGIYEDWVIRANTVIVDHWHGITVMGARRVLISKNTVVDSNPGSPGAPWITITAHKNGRISEDSVIEQNITQPWAGKRNGQFKQPQPGVRSSGNRTVATPQEALSIRR